MHLFTFFSHKVHFIILYSIFLDIIDNSLRKTKFGKDFSRNKFERTT